MSGLLVQALGLLLLGLAAEAKEWAATPGEEVMIRKVGYPVHFVHERVACGQRLAGKSAWNPDYFLHVVFGGFREGKCSDIGYDRFEESANISERSFPFLRRHNTSFGVYSRDPTALDVAGCIGRECQQEVSALEASPYVKDVVHCVSPAFGPCKAKAWQCLGDGVCRGALGCLPAVAKTCGTDVWKVVTNPEERKKVACIWQCGNSTKCVLEKCGKVALECLTGADALCHKAAVCLPQELLKCSAPALKCFLDKDGICRDNLSCLARGVGLCADPSVNALTDKSIAGLVMCANQRCPAPSGTPKALPLTLEPPEHYPEQLACMSLHCAGEVAGLIGDRDVKALTSCLADGLDGCNDKLWACLGDQSCAKDLRCWVDGAIDDSSDLWRMLTDPKERSFDAELVACVSTCSKRAHRVAKALCVATTCGPKAVKCFGDSTCRGVFTDLPKTVLRCGSHSLKDRKLMDTVKCLARTVKGCSRAGVELARDQNLAKLITCNAQCARQPREAATLVV